MVVGDDHKDGFASVFSPDTKLVEPTCVTDGYLAVWGDDIVADAPFFFRFVVGFGFGAGGVDLMWCPPSEGSMGSDSVVVVGKGVELLLEFDQGDRWGLGSNPFFKGLVEPFDLPLCLGWPGRPFFCWMWYLLRVFSKALRPPLAPARRAVNTSPLSVRVDAGGP